MTADPLQHPSGFRYPSEEHAKIDRDLAGRFAEGNAGGPGNPFGRQVSNIRKALLKAIDAERIVKIGEKLASMAEEGNVAAAKLLFSYVIGTPQPAPEPDRMDVEEWQNFRDTAAMKPEAFELSQAGEPEQHLKLVRMVRPLASAQMRMQIAEACAKHQERLNESPEDRRQREEAEAAEASRILHGPAPEISPELEEKISGRPPASKAKARNPLPPPSRNGRIHVDT